MGADVFEDVVLRHRAWFEAAAVDAAWALDLFDALPSSAEQAAHRLGVSAHRLAALLDVLALAGAVTEDRGTYFPASPPPPRGVPAEGWGRLAEVIRADAPLPAPSADYQGPVFAQGRAAAEALAERITPRLLLDAGGGAGAYAAAVLERHPRCRVTLADQPDVLEQSGPLVARFGDRVRLLPADLFTDPLGADYDHALLVNVLHFYGPRDCAALVRRVASALGPGGRLVVKDLSPRTVAGRLFALNMALYTQEGRVWDAPAIRRWLAQAGLTELEESPLPCSPGSLVLSARRPVALTPAPT